MSERIGIRLLDWLGIDKTHVQRVDISDGVGGKPTVTVVRLILGKVENVLSPITEEYVIVPRTHEPEDKESRA